MTSFHLSPEILMAANCLGSWLAQNDFSTAPQSADMQLIVLAGNAVMPTIDAACRLASESGKTLLISGGIGHSTSFLYQAITQHPRYHTIGINNQAEATLLADIAHIFWHIPREQIVVEDQSTNCGENAWFTRHRLEEKGIHPVQAVVVQDPTMQRRTMATFARVWQDVEDKPVWLSYPGITPVLEAGDTGVMFQQPQSGLWSVARYLSLILGELPRLRDDAQGYGPRGKNFIAHVDIPDEIDAAWQLLAADPQLQRVLGSRVIA